MYIIEARHNDFVLKSK